MLLFVVDPANRRSIPLGQIMDAYGLTHAEARVALAASSGNTIIETAQSLGLSPNTIKTHLRHARENRDRPSVRARRPDRRDRQRADRGAGSGHDIARKPVVSNASMCPPPLVRPLTSLRSSSDSMPPRRLTRRGVRHGRRRRAADGPRATLARALSQAGDPDTAGQNAWAAPICRTHGTRISIRSPFPGMEN